MLVSSSPFPHAHPIPTFLVNFFHIPLDSQKQFNYLRFSSPHLFFPFGNIYIFCEFCFAVFKNHLIQLISWCFVRPSILVVSFLNASSIKDSGAFVSYSLFAFERMCSYKVDFWKMNVKDTGVSQKGMVLQTVVHPIDLNVYCRPKGEIIKLFNVYTE